MPDLPSPDFKPEDVDDLIKSYGKPLEPARKEALMDRLRAEQEKINKREVANIKDATEQRKDRGR